jgi:hypothetical protein
MTMEQIFCKRKGTYYAKYHLDNVDKKSKDKASTMQKVNNNRPDIYSEVNIGLSICPNLKHFICATILEVPSIHSLCNL